MWGKLLILAFLFLANSCASFVAYHPTTVRTSIGPNDLYAAAVRVFVRRGWGLQSRDPDARVVETEYVRVPGTYGGWGSRVFVSYRVMVGPGRIEIFTSCRMSYANGSPCPDNQRPVGTSDFEQELSTSIVTEANGLARPR